MCAIVRKPFVDKVLCLMYQIRSMTCIQPVNTQYSAIDQYYYSSANSVEVHDVTVSREDLLSAST